MLLSPYLVAVAVSVCATILSHNGHFVRAIHGLALLPSTGSPDAASAVAVAAAWPLIVAAVALLVLSAALSAAEAALFSLSSEHVESLERQGRHGILATKALLVSRDEALMTLLVADYVVNLALVASVLIAFSRVFPGQPILWAPLGGVVSVIAIIVVGEFLPRALGRSFNESVSLMLAPPIVGLTFLLTPLRWLILAVSHALCGRVGDSLLEREMGKEEKLKTLITASDLNGGLEEDERELISGVFEFGATCAGEIMTPRPRILAFSAETAHDEIVRQMRRCKFKRVLIYRESLDQVSGLLHVKDVLLNPQTDYRDLLRRPLVVPESKKLMDLLREFRRRRVHLAVVCDEFGQTAGIVTLQDLLEQIVGDMAEEDRQEPEPIRSVGPSAWLVLGRTRLADLREQIGLDLRAETGRTVSGFVASRLGRIPAVGDSIAEGEFSLTVERMAVRRVAILRIERRAQATTYETGEAS